jgi:hypothetical protein
MESDQIFQSHGCSHLTKLGPSHREWLSRNVIKESKFNVGQPYVSFQSQSVNHFLWGGSYGSAEPVFGVYSIEDLINSEFSADSSGVTLMTYNLQEGLVISARRFTLSLGLAFRQWAGYTQEFIVFNALSGQSFLLDDAWGYCVYSRNQKVHPVLTLPITDGDLVVTFQKISLEYGVDRIDTSIRSHLASEILPLCEERLA